jgi:hypothetical protein
LGRVAVPLFFLISGFLFFRNVDFDGQTYVRKLRSRARTLLVPYLFWNLSILLFYCFVHAVPALNVFLNRHMEFSYRFMLDALWGGVAEGKTTMPIAYPFWFIRDLMVLVILTPLVHVYVRKAGVYGVLLLCLLWFCNWWFVVPGLSITAVFFFTTGAWLSVSRRNLTLEAEKLRHFAFALYPTLVIADMLTKGGEINPFVHKAGIVFGILFWVNVGLSSVRTTVITITKYKTVKAASVVGFSQTNNNFLIGDNTHGSWTAKTKNDAVERNLLGLITVVLTGLGLYYVLRRFLPNFTNVITGGR